LPRPAVWQDRDAAMHTRHTCSENKHRHTKFSPTASSCHVDRDSPDSRRESSQSPARLPLWRPAPRLTPTRSQTCGNGRCPDVVVAATHEIVRHLVQVSFPDIPRVSAVEEWGNGKSELHHIHRFVLHVQWRPAPQPERHGLPPLTNDRGWRRTPPYHQGSRDNTSQQPGRSSCWPREQSVCTHGVNPLVK